MDHRLRLKVIQKIRETDRAATLVLEPWEKPLVYRPGQFLTFIFGHLGTKEVRRSYSLSSAPGIDPYPAITVKRQVNGLVSHYLVDLVGPGEYLTSLPPAGRFTLEAYSQQPRDIFLFGGGSGIAPLFSIIKYILKFEPTCRVFLTYANRSESAIIFRGALTQLATRHPQRFHCTHLLSVPKGNILRPGKSLKVVKGRLSNAMVEALILKHAIHPPERAQFFLCGPEGLMLKTAMALGYMGYTDDQIHREIFRVKASRRPSPVDLTDCHVTLQFDGKRLAFPLTAGQTILEAAQNAGIELPYSCRSGICTTCSGKCLEGVIEMYTQEGLLNTQTTRGLVLTCVGFPKSRKVVIQF